MAFEIPSDLHRDLVPFAWLLGRWHGSGRTEYPGTDAYAFEQDIVFAHDGRDFLHFFSQAWVVDDDGERQGPGPIETGFLRPVTDETGDAPSETGDRAGAGPQSRGVELVLAHPTGYAEIWYGTLEGPRLTLQTDLVARTQSATEYTAGQRMYGLVEGDLMYAYDIAYDGNPMQSHTWGRLARA